MSAAEPLLMGVVNVTPDSFSDGGKFFDPAAAVAQAKALINAGAAMVDLGAEASSFFRPGVAAVPAQEQLRRLRPVLHQLAGIGTVSVDTRSAEVARELAILHSPLIINDISAGTHDPDMLAAVAEGGASMVLMHMSPEYPASPAADDADIVARVSEYLGRRIDVAVAAGIARGRLWIDPGIGFGKTLADNWRLVLEVERLGKLGCPVVLGASRKRLLQSIGEGPQSLVMAPIMERLAGLAHLEEHERDVASAAVTVFAAERGVQVHRVHNVALAAAALKIFA